jgi:hypothetical protein
MLQEEIPVGDRRILIVSLTEVKLVGVMSIASTAKSLRERSGGHFDNFGKSHFF